jgi:hypothetical protein
MLRSVMLRSVGTSSVEFCQVKGFTMPRKRQPKEIWMITRERVWERDGRDAAVTTFYVRIFGIAV